MRGRGPVWMELQDHFEPPCGSLAMPLLVHPLLGRGPPLQPVFFSLTTIYVPDNSTQHRANASTRAPTDQPDTQPPTTPLTVIWTRAPTPHPRSSPPPHLLPYPSLQLSLAVFMAVTRHGREWLSEEWLPVRPKNEALANSAPDQLGCPQAAFLAFSPPGTVVRVEPPHTFSPKQVVSDEGLLLLGGALKSWRKYEDVEINRGESQEAGDVTWQVRN